MLTRSTALRRTTGLLRKVPLQPGSGQLQRSGLRPALRLVPREPPATDCDPLLAAERKPAARRGTYAGTTAAPRHKSIAVRSRRLLDLAAGQDCLLLVSGICNRDPSTTVPCHSNSSQHGKAGARKADDTYSVWGCAACHAWLDEGPAPAEQKRATFDAALIRQLQRWGDVASDSSRPARDRAVAAWAIEQLKRAT